MNYWESLEVPLLIIPAIYWQYIQKVNPLNVTKHFIYISIVTFYLDDMGPPGGKKGPPTYTPPDISPQYVQPQRTYNTQPAPPPTEHDELPAQDSHDTVDGRSGGARSRLDVNLSYHRSTVDEVAEDTPSLLTQFIVDRMENDGIDVPPGLSQRQHNVQSEVAKVLQKIGDDMSNNRNLNHLISEIQVTPNTAYKTFVSVAAQIFQDGTINWGRIVTLFYFAYKLALQCVNQLPLIDLIIGWVTKYVTETLAGWIAARGGWNSIREYFGSPTYQLLAVFFAGMLLSTLFWRWKK